MSGQDKGARAALRWADAETLLDLNPDFIFAKDRGYRFLFANRAYASFVGSTPEALVGREDTEFIQVPDEAAATGDSFRALDAEVLEGEVITRSNVPALRKGVLHQFDVHKVPMHDDGGNIIGVLTQARDVTATLRAEEGLRESEARYRLLLEHAPVAIYVHDGKNVVFGNQAFAKLMGAASPAALIGYPVIEIAHPDERSRLAERVRAVAAGLVASPSMAFRVVRLDGKITPARVMATRCVFEGRPAIQVVAIDETERHRAEAEREALETQLRHAQRLEALGTLAGGIAHDFNNMLAVMVANAQLAQVALPADHSAQANIDQLLIATSRASELVRAILAFSRKQPIERAPVRLADSVEEAGRLLRATLPAAIALEVGVRASDTNVVADVTQVHQALMNLCTNAWHAMSGERAGRIWIDVDSVVVDQAGVQPHADLRVGPYVRVSIRDNGVGMSAETMAHVFDPFFTTKAVGSGTGLGLSVVHGIMKGHGGAVTVSSEPGVGTEFRLYFPADATRAPTRAESERPEPSLGDRNVMLVDDERAVLSVARRVLEHLGLRVAAHDSLSAALAALARDPSAYDLIMTDHNMPGGSGLDLVKEARRLRPGIPIILTSGFLDDAVRDRARALGVRVLLGKPFNMAQLTDAIERALAVDAT